MERLKGSKGGKVGLPIENDQLIFAIAKNVTHKKRVEADTNVLLKRNGASGGKMEITSESNKGTTVVINIAP